MELEIHEMAWCSLDYKCLLEITGMVSRMASAPSTSSSEWTDFILTTSKASPHKNFWWIIIITVQLNSYSEGWQIPSSCHWEANGCPGVYSGGPESSVCGEAVEGGSWTNELSQIQWGMGEGDIQRYPVGQAPAADRSPLCMLGHGSWERPMTYSGLEWTVVAYCLFNKVSQEKNINLTSKTGFYFVVPILPGNHYVNKDDLELTEIWWPPSSDCWNLRHIPTCLATLFLISLHSWQTKQNPQPKPSFTAIISSLIWWSKSNASVCSMETD